VGRFCHKLVSKREIKLAIISLAAKRFHFPGQFSHWKFKFYSKLLNCLKKIMMLAKTRFYENKNTFTNVCHNCCRNRRYCSV